MDVDTAALEVALQDVQAKYSEGPQSGIFTDGGCRPNPGPGGWGFVQVLNGEIVTQGYGTDTDTTNNRMELTALIEAYKIIPPDTAITVYSDSNLCVQTITTWAKGWEQRGWKRKGGPIKNLELVQELYSLSKERPRVELKWIKAHNGWLWNEYVDMLSQSWTL